MSISGKDPVHPSPIPHPHRNVPGITLRQHFAGLAMQALVASPDTTEASMEMIASDAVLFADKLLAELAKAKP